MSLNLEIKTEKNNAKDLDFLTLSKFIAIFIMQFIQTFYHDHIYHYSYRI